MLRRAIALGTFAVAIAAGVFTLDLARDHPGYGLVGRSALDAAALLAPGWALVAVGLVAWLQRGESRFGPLLVLAGFAWFLPEWDNPGVGSAVAFTVGLCLFAACPPLVGHALLVYPTGRLRSRVERAVVAFAYAAFVLVLGLVPALFFDPQAQACSACPQNLAALGNRETLAADLARLGIYLGFAGAAALTMLVVSRVGRPATRPVVAAGTAYLALVAVTFALSLGNDSLADGMTQRRLWLGQGLALLGVAAGVAWAWYRARRARAGMARLVVELAQSPPPGGLRDLLAGIARDPELVLAYPRDSGRLVDGSGREIELPPGHQHTPLVSDGRVVAVLAHAPGLLDDEQLVDDVTSAARLALENERLQAEVRSRLEDLRASRARIVATGDAERRRLERDLHDGAQQRLVALSLSIRLARLGAPDVVELQEAERELGLAIAELRELAHGIFPAVLADDGLDAAVHALAEEAPVPMRVGDLPLARFDQALETAAYTVVAESVRAARGGVTVRARQENGTLAVEVATGRVDGLDVVALEDRLGALDGRLEVDAGDGATTVRAELPCAS